MSPGQQIWILEHLRELTGDDPLVMAEAAGMSPPTLAAYYRGIVSVLGNDAEGAAIEQ